MTYRNNDDTFTTRARGSTTKAFERSLRDKYGSLGSSYFYTISHDIVIIGNDLIARKIDGYKPIENPDKKWVEYRSKMLARVEVNLNKTHPYYDAIMNDLREERATFSTKTD